MTLKETSRWEITAVATGVAIIFLNPFSFVIGKPIWRTVGNVDWYINEYDTPMPAGFTLHVILMFFVIYLFMRLNWKVEE